MEQIKFYRGSGIPSNMDTSSLYFTDAGRLYDGRTGKLIGESLDKLSIGDGVVATQALYSFAQGVTYNNVPTSANNAAAFSSGAGTTASAQASHAEGALTRTYDTSETVYVLKEDCTTLIESVNLSADDQKAARPNKNAGAHAEGMFTHSFGDGTHSEGFATYAYVNGAHAEGVASRAKGEASHSEGWNTLADGNQSHAEGTQTQALGNSAHSQGRYTVAKGYASHAEGIRTYAGSGAAVPEDTNSMDFSTDGVAAHAEGQGTAASGNSAHAEGWKTEAIGRYSHAEGHHTRAGITGSEGSHAEGSYTTASSTGAHAEGYNTQAVGYASHAGGQNTTAHGIAAFASGFGCEADAPYSAAFGQYTNALKTGQFVIGRYNAYNTESLFVIGGGTNTERKSIFQINENANVLTTGSLNVNAELKNYGSNSASFTSMFNNNTYKKCALISFSKDILFDSGVGSRVTQITIEGVTPQLCFYSTTDGVSGSASIYQSDHDYFYVQADSQIESLFTYIDQDGYILEENGFGGRKLQPYNVTTRVPTILTFTTESSNPEFTVQTSTGILFEGSLETPYELKGEFEVTFQVNPSYRVDGDLLITDVVINNFYTKHLGDGKEHALDINVFNPSENTFSGSDITCVYADPNSVSIRPIIQW